MIQRSRLRGGERVAQDRLWSGLISFFFIVPAGSLIYGWSIRYAVGGLVLLVVAAFFAGFGLMAAFSGLNTYIAGKSRQYLHARFGVRNPH